MDSRIRYLAASILAHILILGLLALLAERDSRGLSQANKITFELIENTASEKASQTSKDEKKLIVDQEKVNSEEDPEAKYLSSHSQKVAKETVAKNHGTFQNKKIKEAASAPPSSSSAAVETRDSKPQAKPQSKPQSAPSGVPLPKGLFGSYKDSLAKAMDSSFGPASNKELGSGGGETSQTRDYLPDKEAGLETLLSTKEFVYYSYYNRIRNQLSQYWEPKIKQKMMAIYRKGRRIASAEDRITKVLITLDSGGILTNVQVLGQSGIQDLDEAAVEAFRAAAPFPNPPKGIVENDGTVKIQWDFIVET